MALPPEGFPACRRCPYVAMHEVGVCLRCSTGGLPAVRGEPCPVCEQAMGPDRRCSNDWCGRGDRWFSVVWSIGPHVGAWRSVIGAYKYRHEIGWAAVLGRVLLGYLDEHMPWFDDYDLIVPMPAFTGRGARRDWDPVGEVVAVAAHLAGPCWDFCPGVIVKDRETPALAGLARPARRTRAEGQLRPALRIPDPGGVAGCRVLVVDDVFTEGSTLREVARALMLAGAEEVGGLTLARQPWQHAPLPDGLVPPARQPPGRA
jgi:predicted amidophosphoribosyltransferase